ncbi:MAG: TonB-dependent receptor PqqU [Bacteroidales bacterium]
MPIQAQKDSVPEAVSDTLQLPLDEVVITGSRAERRIIDLPFPVDIVGEIDFRNERKAGADEILAPVPGLFLQSRYGNHDVRFSIRGFGSRSNSGIRGVRILLDGIPESEPDGQTRIEAIDFNAIRQVEVARGNNSSLYTNAPGGVVNFISDYLIDTTSVQLYHESGSFGLMRNGFKVRVRSGPWRVMSTLTRHRYDGYREHSSDKWDIFNMVIQTTPTKHSTLTLFGTFVDGMIRLPGSLTLKEYQSDPYQADPKSVDRDQKRISTKGRFAVRFKNKWGGRYYKSLTITGYTNIKYFERTSSDYRIINRYGLGLRTTFLLKTPPGRWAHEFLAGADFLFQPARTEHYENIGGVKGDQIQQLTSEEIGNSGFFVSENLTLIPGKLNLFATGRYDHVVFRLNEETLPLREDSRLFSAFTPKVSVNYKAGPGRTFFISGGLGFDTPAKNELDSFDPEFLYNHELKAQESVNLEVGWKEQYSGGHHPVIGQINAGLTLFHLDMRNEIVPYEVLGEVFFKNAAHTTRTGIEAGAEMQLARVIRINAAYTWFHFVYRSYETENIRLDENGQPVTEIRNFDGMILPSVPVNNLYLAARLKQPVGRQASIIARASFRNIGTMYADDANQAPAGNYLLVNLTGGVEWRAGRLEGAVSGGILNLLDEHYVGFTNTNSADGRYYEPGAPRSWMLNIRLGYRF